MIGCDNDVLSCQTKWNSYAIGVLDLQDLYYVWKEKKPEECFQIMKNVFMWVKESQKFQESNSLKIITTNLLLVFGRYHLQQNKKKNQNIAHKFIKSQWASNSHIAF